jgi:hypothetical protein
MSLEDAKKTQGASEREDEIQKRRGEVEKKCTQYFWLRSQFLQYSTRFEFPTLETAGASGGIAPSANAPFWLLVVNMSQRRHIAEEVT